MGARVLSLAGMTRFVTKGGGEARARASQGHVGLSPGDRVPAGARLGAGEGQVLEDGANWQSQACRGLLASGSSKVEKQ